MDEPQLRPDGLQLDEHRRFQARFWKVERVAWVAFAIVTICALLGLTGAGGPLASMSAKDSGAVISYPRVSRWETADELEIVLRPKEGVTNRSVTLAPGFAKSFQLEDVQPQPIKTTMSLEGQTLVFETPDAQGGRIIMHIRAQSVGRSSFTIKIDDGTPNVLTTYVLP